MAISRRDFIKTAALTASTITLSEALFQAAMAKEPRVKEETIYVPTFCEICFWKCGAIAKVVNDKVVKLDGSPLHPNSRGKLCARGNAGMGLLYDPDRLKYPLINTGARGEGRFKKASWDSALDFIAEKMTNIKEDYGSEAVALYTHGAGGNFFEHLIKAYGSPNITQPSFAQCRGPRDIGYLLTFGESVGSPEYLDLPNTRFIVLFGSHLGENMHNSQVQDFAEAISRGAKLLVVDPRFSTAAGKAHWWFPIKPGTDTALLLSWIREILYEELYDKKYIAKYAIGLEELKEAVKEYTPEWAERQTDIPANFIIDTAKEMSIYKPSVVIHPGRHSTWYGNDTQRARAMAILTALLGTWGRKGGIFLPTKASLPKGEDRTYPEASKKPISGDYPYAYGAITTEVREAMITGKPYPVKGMFVYGCNLLKAIPNQEKTIKAMKKLDLSVVIEVLPSEVTQLADVILPECTYLERYDDLVVNKGHFLSVSLRQPAVKPMFESRPAWWIAKEIGTKLELDSYWDYNDIEEYLNRKCEMMGIRFDILKERGTITFPDTANPYIKPNNEPEFGTESGKIELYSHELKDYGFDPVPKYERTMPVPDDYFRLLYGRSPVHTFSRTINNVWLNELKPENEVWINKVIASNLGIRDGDYVVLINQDGVKSNRIKAKVTERIRRDAVYLIHGYGSSAKGLNKAYKMGADDQALITQYVVDPLTGGTGMRVNFVKILREV